MNIAGTWSVRVQTASHATSWTSACLAAQYQGSGEKINRMHVVRRGCLCLAASLQAGTLGLGLCSHPDLSWVTGMAVGQWPKGTAMSDLVVWCGGKMASCANRIVCEDDPSHPSTSGF
jgi:hypothetical protein